MILNTFTKFKRKDLLLIAALNNIQSLPMCTRWNTRKHAETSPQRLVFYIKHIQLPLTRVDESKKPYNVEKLFQSNMGRKKYASVTYDLAIAKIEKRIQCVKKNYSLIMFLSCLVIFILNWHSSDLQKKLLRAPKDRIYFQKVLSSQWAPRKNF